MKYLVKIMEDSEFRRNRIDTTWLDKRIRADAARSHALSEELSSDAVNAQSLSMSSSVIIAIVGAACRAHQIKIGVATAAKYRTSWSQMCSVSTTHISLLQH